MTTTLSQFARGLSTETAFDVLAVAKRLKAQGKDVIELQIGDSPFSSTARAIEAGTKAIKDGQTHYCPSLGLMSFRETVAANYKKEYGIAVGPENVIVGPGAKVFEQFFCEAFLDPGDAWCYGVQPGVSDLCPEHRAAAAPYHRYVPSGSKSTPFAPICTTSRKPSSRIRRGPRRSSSIPRRTTRPAASPTRKRPPGDRRSRARFRKNIAVFSG